MANQSLFISCIFIKPNVWYSWSLEIFAIKKWFPLNFAKVLKRRHLVMSCSEDFKLLPDNSYDSGFQKIILSSLLLFFCACYFVHLCNIQWNKVATSTTCNFNNKWPLNLNFSNMMNHWSNIWFIKNSKCHQFLFCKRSHQKTPTFSFFKGPLFCNGWPYWYQCWCVLRDFCGLSKSCSFTTFTKW